MGKLWKTTSVQLRESTEGEVTKIAVFNEFSCLHHVENVILDGLKSTESTKLRKKKTPLILSQANLLPWTGSDQG